MTTDLTMERPAEKPAFEPLDFQSGATPIWCPGCGHYGVLSALEHALAMHGRPPHDIVLVSGIGCSSRLPAYTSCYGFHGVHGRALPFATGLKLARPDLEVIAVGGDGDGYSIGGNHFVHACRRDLNMVYIVMDNRVYGMTKGQPSPTTEADWDSDIAPGGLGLRPVNPVALAIAAGARFVARGFSGRSRELAELIVEGLRWPGFAYIEVLSPCVAFRPEKFSWKASSAPAAKTVEDDRAAAFAAVLAGDEASTGILFRDHAAGPHPPVAKPGTIEEIESRFAVCG
ncbi:thiamine pyrophosphate-dependent enzyme [Rhizobiaceae bacterium BDR2-2]|uniref:Thiamine pyrophosphate-dependent enzyme n=1 Tax=Ectorhizobium quercum TaxID=2965071 RepID=A0AAE3SWH7_9HYPH|nr:thiamine pyrophosphate-dependent enzyme [Ectorhizobium quercum]MCX8997450.1 thiamine pyrophosphate-dependent enzyme [Ectorhizobium quercum]